MRATASALQVRPSIVPMKPRCHQHSPCHSDELFPLATLTGLARGGPIKGPSYGPESGFTSMITGLFVIIGVKPDPGPDNGLIMGAAIWSRKPPPTLQSYRRTFHAGARQHQAVPSL